MAKVPILPRSRRLFLAFLPGVAGKTVLALTRSTAAIPEAMAIATVEGMIKGDDATLDVDVVSNPAADPALKGEAGGQGPNGWTPMLRPEADGTRTLIKVADWMRSSDKPSTGYLTSTGALEADKAKAFNFNSVKRVDVFTATTSTTTADGAVAAVTFSPEFASVPAKALPLAANNLLGGVVTAEIVPGSLTKSGCKVLVKQKGLLTGLFAAVVGSNVAVIAIEA